MGLKGKYFVHSTTDVSYASTLKSHVVPEDSKRCEIFHIRVISKNTKIDTLIDSGSKFNLILEEVVKQLGLETKLAKRLYPLGWVCNDNRLRVTKQCKLRFAITSKFMRLNLMLFHLIFVGLCWVAHTYMI